MNFIRSANSSKAGRRRYRHPSRSSALQKLGPFASRWLGLTLATGSLLFAEPLPAATPLAWGRGDYGQLGDGNFYNTPPHFGTATVVDVSGLTTVRAIAGGGLHSLALNSDGTVSAWGDGQLGQLGDGNFYTSPPGVATPVQVSGLTTVTAIAGGTYHSLALKSDGTVWTWGHGDSGQLGDGNFYTTGNQGVATPVQVSGLTSVTAIAGGGEHSLALKSDGTVWAWGKGQSGQLGDGNFYTTGNLGVATPVQVIGLTNVTAIAAGGIHSLALKADGTVWAWGDNQFGQLGDGTFFIGEAAPVQVIGLSAIVAIAAGSSHNLALQALPDGVDGSVWAWGSGANGEVGDGNFYPGGVATPVQATYLYFPPSGHVAAIACGGSHNLALDSNGMVKAWGAGGYGQLADNSYPAGLVTPVSPNLGQQARAIAAGSGHSLALPSTPPTLTIDQPLEGASFAGPADVTIEATVIDIDGLVTQVDFYSNACNNTTLEGTVNAPPYRFTLNSVTSGNYSIFVGAGGEFSTLVNFSVVGPIQSLVNAAAPDNTVDIPAGAYLDTVVINKNLTLRGAGARSTVIDGNNGCGPAVVVTGGATVTISDLTVTRGGILNDSTLTVNDCAITGNDTFSGIQNGTLRTLFMNNCTVSGNVILEDGGGVYNQGTMILNGCTISGNVTGMDPYGGGGAGGGLFNVGTLSLNNCTVTGNTAPASRYGGGDGGGIANFPPGTVSCKSTIIANNFDSVISGNGGVLSPDFYGDLNSQGYNLIGNTAGAIILGITTGNLLNIDPLLGPLQNNGGPTDTHALLPGSPAIDAGISGGSNTDQRGVPRPIDIPSLPNAADGSDIGAYEFNSGAPTLNIACPADIAAHNDPGQCSAVVNYPPPLVSGGTGNVVVVCNPPSSSVFPIGTTTVNCTATDASDNTATCSFIVTVNDTELPQGSCAAVIPFRILQNPLRKVGRLQLLAADNCDPDPKIYIGDSRSSFVAGPFHNLDLIEIGAGPSLTPNQHAPAGGPAVAVVFTKGDPLLWAVDSSGNVSTSVKCK